MNTLSKIFMAVFCLCFIGSMLAFFRDMICVLEHYAATGNFRTPALIFSIGMLIIGLLFAGLVFLIHKEQKTDYENFY